MFRIAYRPNPFTQPDVTLRTAPDWGNDVPLEIIGTTQGNRILFFELDESAITNQIEFKFVLRLPGGDLRWNKRSINPYGAVSENGNFIIQKSDIVNGSLFEFTWQKVEFSEGPRNTPFIEESTFANQFIPPTRDEAKLWDVIVVGSGMGGGVVAEQLAESREGNRDLDVLVLEAGSDLFPVHTANLPRRHRIDGIEDNQITKHIWELWDDYKIVNIQDKNADNSDRSKQYVGGAGYNLGGRSVFWGGLIPRIQKWELERDWPSTVKDYLLSTGYDEAEKLMNLGELESEFQKEVVKTLTQVLSPLGFSKPENAPMAVENSQAMGRGISAGMFSSADLLLEALLTQSQRVSNPEEHHLRINLNHPVNRIEIVSEHEVKVECYDLSLGQERTFRCKRVVLAAGCLDTPRIVMRSSTIPNNSLVGKGITDHPVFFWHFKLPRPSQFNSDNNFGNAAKVVAFDHEYLEVTNVHEIEHPFLTLVEVGTDLNQSRYLDSELENLLVQELKDGSKECEVVFLLNSELLDHESSITQGSDNGDFFTTDIVNVKQSTSSVSEQKLQRLALKIIQALGGSLLGNNAPDLSSEKIDSLSDRRIKELAQGDWDSNGQSDENSGWGRGGIGGVAHEVGTMRMKSQGGVVNEDLQVVGTTNVYVCDLSVFPDSPTANPSLTLVALALRLAEHLREELN